MLASLWHLFGVAGTLLRLRYKRKDCGYALNTKIGFSVLLSDVFVLVLLLVFYVCNIKAKMLLQSWGRKGCCWMPWPLWRSP